MNLYTFKNLFAFRDPCFLNMRPASARQSSRRQHSPAQAPSLGQRPSGGKQMTDPPASGEQRNVGFCAGQDRGRGGFGGGGARRMRTAGQEARRPALRCPSPLRRRGGRCGSLVLRSPAGVPTSPFRREDWGCRETKGLLSWQGSPFFTTSIHGAEWSPSAGFWLQLEWRGVTGKSTSQSDQKDPATVRGFLKAEVVDTLRKSCPSHESRKARISG
ncbi:uncharacterized protein isoform X6 [Castor canadensis]